MNSKGNQFGRSISLIVASTTITPSASSNQGIDLSQLHIKFEVSGADTETPNTAVIRVYNLSDDTSKSIITEYNQVTLQAGYANGNFGIIFKGTIKQFRRGRERNVDNYLDILAADGDLGYNFGVINTTFPPSTSPQQQLAAYASAMGLSVDPNANQFLTGGVVLNPRSKTAFGLARIYMRDLMETHQCRWSIQNGAVVIVPLTGYLPGQAVQVNSSTGMIGVPEATDDGVHVTTLLNPLVRIGGRVQINNKDISQTTIKEQFFPSFTSPATLIANTNNDGFYRILLVEHKGDTRSTEWYTSMVCLNLDPSAVPVGSVLPF